MVSCTRGADVQNANKTHDDSDRTLKNSALILDTFSNLPPEIERSARYFARDSSEFRKGRYINLNDFAQTGFVKVKGTFTKVLQIEFEKRNKLSAASKKWGV